MNRGFLCLLGCGFLLLSLVHPGCFRGNTCRTDSGCPNAHLCRNGACIARSALLADGDVCTNAALCLSGRCQQGLCYRASPEPSQEKSQEKSQEPPHADTAADAGPTDTPRESVPRCQGPTCLHWAVPLVGPGRNVTNVLLTTPQGELIVGGVFEGAMTVQGTSLIAYGRQDGFLAKFSADGVLIWLKRIGGYLDDGIDAIAVDKQGNLYVGGYFHYAMFGAKGILKTYGKELDEKEKRVEGFRDFDYDAFVYKYSPKGIPIWTVVMGGQLQPDALTGLVVGPKEDVYITGKFQGFARFGTHRKTSVREGQFLTADVFVARLTGNGEFAWVSTAGGLSLDAASSLSLAGDHLLVTGTFSQDVTFGTHRLQSTKGGREDGFVASIDRQGQWQWARSHGSKGKLLLLQANTTPEHKTLCIAGRFEDETSLGGTSHGKNGEQGAFLALLDERGQLLWSKGFLNASNGHVRMTPKGGCLFALNALGTVTIGKQTLVPIGQSLSALASFGPDGSLLWAEITSADAPSIKHLLIDKTRLFLGGYFLDMWQQAPAVDKAKGFSWKAPKLHDAFVGWMPWPPVE